MVEPAKNKKIIGAHVSSAGGVEKAVARAADLGCTAMQVFSGSPRSWARKAIDQLNVESYQAAREQLNIRAVFTHSLYLVNLASPKADLLTKSMAAVSYDLEFDAAVGGSGVVVHLGSHLGVGWEAVREQVRDRVIEILDATPANSHLLIENSAGQKGKLCSNLEEIRWLLDAVDSERLGWCVDTCHAHAAGFRLAQVQAEAGKDEKTLVAEIEHLNLWESLKCVHVNDSKDDFGSGRDRHENFLQGSIDPDDFVAFLNDERVCKLPLITEVPGFDGKGPDVQNVQAIQKAVGIAQ